MSKTVGTATSQFAWDESGTTPLLLSDGTYSFVYGPGGIPIEQIDASGNPTYLSQDQLGSTRLLTNSVGAVSATYSYDPYGNVTAKTGTATTPIGFASGYTDAESGLQYLINRYYDPATGQFLSVDPAFAVTGSRYGYVGDSPLNGIDPLGLSWWNPASWTANTWGIAASVVGVAAGATLLCAATVCIGDIAVAGGATTLAGTLGAAEATANVATAVAFGSAIVGGIADTYVAWGSCRIGFTWRCGLDIGQVVLDVGTFGGDRFVNEFSIWKPIYAVGASGVALLHGLLNNAAEQPGAASTSIQQTPILPCLA